MFAVSGCENGRVRGSLILQLRIGGLGYRYSPLIMARYN